MTGRDQARGDAVVAEIAATGGTAVFIAADLGDEHATTELVNAAAEQMHGLTVLVNNAAGGDASDGPIGDLGTDAWEAILRVDLTAPMWCARAAIPHMQRAGHGSIVNMSSRQAERASRGLAAYIAAKAGLNGLTRAIAVDYANDGIRCNTISPGYVLNDRRDADITPERRALRGHAPHPAGRGGRRRLRGGVPREPRVGVRDRHQSPARRRQQQRARLTLWIG